MGKKPKTPPTIQTESTQLTHSPFAALKGASAPEASPPLPKAQASPEAPAGSERAAPRGKLVLRRETQHRGGKPVVIVGGFPSTGLGPEEVEALGSALKRALGCGGTVEWVRDAPELVLQGDQPSKVAELLRARGFRVGGVTG